ncbi:MAG: hypothetical protein QOD56_2388 [Gammaproteobacteria bacterium]|nr:hypothetical protein [Gammaproteobacteria bacterium]
MSRLRRAAIARLTRWSARRHGVDSLPISISRRRIYIVPTRFGIALALLLAAMLIAGLNYNSNLGLAFGFLMTSLALVAMHHCHRNLLGLEVNVFGEADAFAGEAARFEFVLHNAAAVERCDIEIRCSAAAAATHSVTTKGYARAAVDLPVGNRGVVHLDRFEVRTRHPFGWFRAWTYVQSPLTVFVAPAPRGSLALPSAAAAVGNSSVSERRGDEDFAGLRAYEAGVPLKHMAWKVLARGGDAAVRSYTGLAAQPEWLEWAALEGLDIETRLSQLCRWVLQSELAQNPYGLRIPGAEIAPGRGPQHRSACLRALATGGTEKQGRDGDQRPAAAAQYSMPGQERW